MKKITQILILLMMSLSLSAAIDYIVGFFKETKAERDKRLEWYRQARFGMFVHFGLYSQLGGQWKGQDIPKYAEWIQCHADIPKAEYEKLINSFNPKSFNAEEWVKTAKSAGMKYIVITSKHHEGFCLWESKLTDYKITNSPFKRDLLKELSESCKKHGVGFGVYYSIIDWHHPSQKPNDGAKGWGRWATLACLDKPGYMKYMRGQLKELVENYDPDILWFDGDWVDWWTEKDGMETYNYLLQLKPSVIVNNRVCKRRTTDPDFGTPENQTPSQVLTYDWEACWTINHSWGFKKSDNTWKSEQTLIRKLIDINSKGGNLLLNVGPDGLGSIPPKSIERLKAMGQWNDVYGKSLHATSPSPVGLPTWGRATVRENTLYFNVFDWPTNNKLIFKDVNFNVEKVYLLRNKEELAFINKNKTLEIDLPSIEVNDNSEVIAVQFTGSIKYDGPNYFIELKDGDVLLHASSAEILGQGPMTLENKHCLANWSALGNSAVWQFELVLPGKYDVIFNYASSGKAGAFEIEVANKKTKANVRKTGSGNRFRQVKVARINISEIGGKRLAVKALRINGKDLMKLNYIILRPLKH